MTIGVKTALRRLLKLSGFDVVRASQQGVGLSPFADMRRFLEREKALTILDVGASVGQSVERFLQAFPSSSVHSFEPSPTTYETLKLRCEGFHRVRTWNRGVGSVNSTLRFLESDHPDMSSFLAPAPSTWGQIVGTIDVEVVSLDWFAKDQGIDFIHVLKSDTQGFELEVLKGADQLMNEGRIGMIYLELILSQMYEGQPSLHEIFQYLATKNFALVAFYDPHFQQELLSWTDALFISRPFHQTVMARIVGGT